MKEIIKKAGVLIEALPYIQEFRGETIVVKFGGSAMEDTACKEGILQDITFLECVGMKTVVVHGGGKAISRGMQEAGLAANFVKGLRVTCEKTIEIVDKVIRHEVNPSVVKILESKQARAQAVHGEDVFSVTKKEERDPETGEMIDWGFVGEPGEVNTRHIEGLLRDQIIPVVTPLGMGADGKIHNINADVAAAALAKAMKARKLAFVSDVPGLLRDADDESTVMATLHLSEVEKLIERGVITGGMLPKVNSGVEALRGGVRKIHMIDGRMPHSLLLEIFTDRGVGTEILNDM